jgi:hypothetical protein
MRTIFLSPDKARVAPVAHRVRFDRERPRRKGVLPILVIRVRTLLAERTPSVRWVKHWVIHRVRTIPVVSTVVAARH